MRKRLVVFGTCLCLMLSFAGCAKKDNKGEENTPSVNEENKVKVTLGQYKGLEVEVDSIEVTDEDVQLYVDDFHKNYGEKTEVKDRVVQNGDIVNIDYLGKIDGVAFDGGADEGFDLGIGSQTFIPGFEEGIIGAKLGETLDVAVKFPEVYKNNPDLAGKEAIFTVTVNKISELAPLTDEVVAKGTENEYTSIDAYKEYIRTNLEQQAEASVTTQKEIDLFSKAIENATFEGLEASEYEAKEKEMKDYYESLAANYNIPLEQYINIVFQGMTLEQYESEIKSAAEFNVKQNYLLKQIVKEENITVSDEEYDKLVEEYLPNTSFKDAAELETSVGGKEKVRESFALEKAIDLIIDSAVVK